MERKHVFLILLILGTAFWGISFPITKIAIGNVSSATFLFYRFFMATIVLAILLSKQLKQITLSTLKDGLLLAAPLVFGIYFQTLGIKHSAASQCAFIAGICVVIIPVIKLVFYRRAVEFKVWLAAIIALAGLAIISIKDNFTISIGDLYTIIGSCGFAIYLINVEKISGAKSILPTIVPMFAICTLITFVLALADSTTIWFPESTAFWKGIIYCALFSTAYMYTVSNLSQQFISAERISIIYLFEPVFAAVAAFFMLGEDLSWRLLIGGGLIFAATLISELIKRKESTVSS